MLNSLRVVASASLLTPLLVAQDLSLADVGASVGSNSGPVAAISDIDGDGRPDVLTSAPALGVVRVVSSAGGVVTSITGAPGFGSVISTAGDLDGDGRADVAVGDPASSSVTIHSSMTGALLAKYGGALGDDFGAALADVGDLDGDSISDLAVGAPGADGDTGSAIIVSGDTGATIFAAYGSAQGDRFGSYVSGQGLGPIAGDNEPGLIIGMAASGDNEPGLIIGMPAGDNEPGLIIGMLAGDNEPGLIIGASPLAAPAYVEWHGFGDGASVRHIEGGDLIGFGAASAVIGDVDGDGQSDLAVGAPGSGVVSVRSGLDGSVLYDLDVGGSFGSDVVFVGDLDGDGVGDYAVADPTRGSAAGMTGRVSVHSGVDGALLHLFDGNADGDLFGASLDVSVTPEGVPELVVSAPGASLGRGSATKLALAGATGVRLTVDGKLSPGSTLTIDVDSASPGDQATLIVGDVLVVDASSASLALLEVVSVPGHVTDDAGQLQATFKLPSDLPVGLLYSQVTLGSGGRSNAVSTRVSS